MVINGYEEEFGRQAKQARQARQKSLTTHK